MTYSRPSGLKPPYPLANFRFCFSSKGSVCGGQGGNRGRLRLAGGGKIGQVVDCDEIAGHLIAERTAGSGEKDPRAQSAAGYIPRPTSDPRGGYRFRRGGLAILRR
ncbi:MAG: hypothetical protein AB9907_06100 [Flexilinea sp.]